MKESPTTFSLGLISLFSILMTLYEFSKNPRNLIVETAPENRKLMSFSFHSHGLCRWPLNTRSGFWWLISFIAVVSFSRRNDGALVQCRSDI